MVGVDYRRMVLEKGERKDGGSIYLYPLPSIKLTKPKGTHVPIII